MQPFVHLRCRTAYSILEGALRPKEIAALCAEYGQPAAAVTDTNNLFGALEVAEALREKGVQPIIGITLAVRFENTADTLSAGPPAPAGTLVLLAQDEVGYGRLMALSSQAFLDEECAVPSVPWADVLSETTGMIALTGGPDGVVDKAFADGRDTAGVDLLSELAKAFPDRLYVEIQRHQGAVRPYEAVLAQAATELNLPAVATVEPYFAKPAQHGAHDALLCIGEGAYLAQTDRRQVTADHYFATGAEMAARFADVPEAVANTLDIARRCAFRPTIRKPILPPFSSEAGRDEPAELAAQAREGLKARLTSITLAAPEQEYWDRLDHELAVISHMGFAGYFLIVADFIKWAKARGVAVGPGRGSGAGSLVAWVLTITNLDPLRFGLLFERFLNPERVSMPDFDIDFCQERRGEVIDYVKEKYGDDRVAQIITFGTLQARAVLRDVGRVMQLPLGQVDRLAKMVPNNPANPVTLAQAVADEPRLQAERDREPEVKRLLETALQLEGLYRNASTHAAGVVIGDRPLKELVALYRDPRSDLPATQFNMKWVELAGLVKFDFLGLKTLTVMERALGFIRQRGIDLDLDALALDDPETYELLSSGAAIGVFQLESTGMRETLRKVRPDKIEDIIALISLYRPGPMKNIDTYVDRKFGRSPVVYPHPTLEAVLKETYGVIIYQEQVMQIAQILSGFSLGEADLLRRAMGKKKRDEMAKQKARFLSGAAERDVDERKATEIFDLVEEFAGYGFNKSHAAAYALIAYHTAYLKAHYPVEFMAALMSLDLHNTEKLASLAQECRRMGVAVLPPDINVSGADFTVEASGSEDRAVRYALGGLKNVGKAAMDGVVDERRRQGGFTSVAEFSRRLDPRLVNKRLIETLGRAGAFDGLTGNRAAIVAGADMILGAAQSAHAERETAQNNLFGGDQAEAARDILPKVDPWTAIKALEEECGAVGFFLSGHPLEDVEDVLQRQDVVFCAGFAAFGAEGRERGKVCGVVQRRQERVSAKSGERFAFLTLSDPTGEFEALVPPDILAVNRDAMEAGAKLVCRARLQSREGEVRVIIDDVQSLETALDGAYGGLRIVLDDGAAAERVRDRLAAIGPGRRGGVGAVSLVVPAQTARARVEIQLPGAHPVDAGARAALKSTPGVAAIEDI